MFLQSPVFVHIQVNYTNQTKNISNVQNWIDWRTWEGIGSIVSMNSNFNNSDKNCASLTRSDILKVQFVVVFDNKEFVSSFSTSLKKLRSVPFSLSKCDKFDWQTEVVSNKLNWTQNNQQKTTDMYSHFDC